MSLKVLPCLFHICTLLYLLKDLMNYRFLFLYSLTALLALGLTADQLSSISLQIPDIRPENSQLRFIKNQGQWGDHIQYRVRLQSGSLFLENQRLTWFFTQMPSSILHHGEAIVKKDHSTLDDSEIVRMHTYHVYFEGANENTTLESNHQFLEYHNYYLGKDRKYWQGGVPLYGIVTYKELYPDIDMRMYGIKDAIKYDFIIQPHTSPEVIQLRYEGADLAIKEGHLHVKTSLNEIIEMAPIAYQVINNQKVAIDCHYQLDHNNLSFHFPNGYDKNYELVIDPTLIFSSFSGSTLDNWGFTATYDNDGNAYAGGIVYDAFFGAQGYPTTFGAYQTAYQGGMADVAISKFDATGTNLLFSTFLGGGNHDQPHSLVVNDANELFILGRTNSTNFPTNFAALDPTANGDYDLFVARFNAGGTNLIASTYLGGSGKDGVNGSEEAFIFANLKYNYGDDARGEIIVDDLGNVYVASPTQSFDFPVTNGSLQTNMAGIQDGCIVKLTPDLNQMVWSTYLGGNNADAAYAMQIDDQYNVYVTGGTMSNDFPITIGAYQGAYQGFPFDNGFDGFVAKISSNGSNLLSSTYLGTNRNDQSYFIQLDEDNDIYVYGQTTGTWPIVSPARGQVYSNPSGKQFITKLNNTLTEVIYSTVFGGSDRSVPNISPTAFLVDKCENVYASGWGGTTNSNITGFGNEGLTFGLPITPDAIQTTTAGDDIYLIVLDRDAQNLLYGTFFGGGDFLTGGREHLDGGTCRFDKNGVIYHAVCAGCGGSNAFPTTPGAWSNFNRSSNCNMAVFKISFDLAGVSADFVPLDTLNAPISNFQGCAPLRVNFENTSQAISGSTTTSYFWDFDDNNTSNQFEPTYTFTDSGTYNVMLVITDPQSCNISDTTYHLIEVFPPATANAGPSFSICGSDSVTLSGSGTSGDLVYAWSPSLGLSNTSIANPKAAPNNTTVYTLAITNENGCIARDTVTVAVAPTLTVDLGNDTTLCVNENMQLNATHPNAIAYNWSPTTFLNDPSSPNPIISGLDQTVTYIVSLNSSEGCTSSDTITVSSFDIEVMPDTTICANESVMLQAQANDTNATYTWTPASSLDDPNALNPLATPTTTTTYTLSAMRPSGCVVTKSVIVNVIPLPIAEAGINDSICIGESLQLQASGGIQYQWNPTNFLSDPNISNPTTTPDINITYVVEVTNGNGCSSVDSVYIEVGEIPVVAAAEDTTICQGEAVQLFASGADVYQWSGPSITDPNIQDPFAQPQTDAQYIVIGTNIFGCSAQDEMNVNVLTGPITSIDGPPIICFGEEATLTASGGNSYIWSTGDTAQSITVSPGSDETYYATAFTQGCSGLSDSIRVEVSTDFPSILFIPSANAGFAPLTVQFLNFSLYANRYEWDFGTGTAPSTELEPTYTFGNVGEYEVTLTAWSASGCSNSSSLIITLDNIAVHIPSAFTPNNDGFNDEFFIGHWGIQIIQMKIFDRWGELIYETTDPNFRWDGKYKEKIVPEGVFTYVFKGLGQNGILYEKSGTITVVK